MNELGMNFINTPELPTPGIFTQDEAVALMNRDLEAELSLVNPMTMYNYYALELTGDSNPNLSSEQIETLQAYLED
jgi:hypothetical protein